MFAKETILCPVKRKENKTNLIPTLEALLSSAGCLVELLLPRLRKQAELSGTGRMSSIVRKVPACCRHLSRADISVFSQKPLSQKQIDRIST